MFNLIQLYVAYRLEELDEPYEWESVLKEFLELVPGIEILSEKLSKKELKRACKNKYKGLFKTRIFK